MLPQNRRRLRHFLLIVTCGVVLVMLTVIACNIIVTNSSRGKTFSDVEKIPVRKVGLLLGTGKYLQNGNLNLYYKYRIDAAADLYHAKKISYIIISGDNSREDYDEPTDMRNDLVARGVDSTAIYLDYAGFRTFDSMIRVKQIFSQDTVTVISQQFHNERAIYIGSQEGIHTIGFNARDVESNAGFKVQMREKLARVKLFLDYLFNEKPKFLGNKVHIPGG